MPPITIKGVLEIDAERGVIYFHSGNQMDALIYGTTPLRICSLPKPIAIPGKYSDGFTLDITHMHGVNYK